MPSMKIFAFLGPFVVSAILTYLVRNLMLKLKILDKPQRGLKGLVRKIHKKDIPLGGGWAIFVTFFAFAFLAFFVGVIGADVKLKNIVGAFLGGLVIMIGGTLDDKYNFKPLEQLIFPLSAALIAIASGIGLESITNPTGGVFYLTGLSLTIEGIGKVVLFADMIVFLWLMGMMYTTKFLDGLDGLVTGVVLIGSVMIFALTEQDKWHQPEVGALALIFAGACSGFLVWNRNPAKIFLGEGGSLLTGYILAILALVSGSKIATTLLVMGLPILDTARVIYNRLRSKRSISKADSGHLHHKLLRSGLSQRQAVYVYYAISFLFGISTLFLQSHQKIVALSFLFILMLQLGVFFSKHEKV